MWELLFPSSCLSCGKMLEFPLPLKLCPLCVQSIPLLPSDFARIHVLDRLEESYLDDLWVPFGFNEALRRLVHHLKYRQMPRLGIAMGRWTGTHLSDRLPSGAPVSLIPVPLHPGRMRERGYNQSGQIARGLGEELHLEVLSDCLVRTRYTQSQTHLNRQERHDNVYRAFALARKVPGHRSTVLLVDDLVTTGATINECARILKQAGVTRVVGIAVATPVEREERLV